MKEFRNKQYQLDTHFTFHFIEVHSLDMFRRLPTSWDQPTTTTAHNSHQPSVCVVPPEDGQVMPETCRDCEPQ
jgi:hypothetical protein